MYTTLNKIRAKSPCTNGWTKVLKNLGKTHADDEPLAITTILESNGLDDALWCLRAVEGRDKEIRLLAVEYARAVQHLVTPESIRLLDVAEAYANGKATKEELGQARAAASAASAASDAAWSAASDAAWSAASDAAWAAWSAARSAAAWAAWSAASAAASAARDAAASDAAWAAARSAAWDAASDAARDAQANLLILVCEGAFNE